MIMNGLPALANTGTAASATSLSVQPMPAMLSRSRLAAVMAGDGATSACSSVRPASFEPRAAA